MSFRWGTQHVVGNAKTPNLIGPQQLMAKKKKNTRVGYDRCVCVCQRKSARSQTPSHRTRHNHKGGRVARTAGPTDADRPTARGLARAGHERSARTVYLAAPGIGASAARTHGRETRAASTGAARTRARVSCASRMPRAAAAAAARLVACAATPQTRRAHLRMMHGMMG